SRRGKWELAIELEVICRFENVKEHSETAADAGLRIVKRLPGKTEPGSNIGRPGEVGTGGHARVTGKCQAYRGLGEHCGLEPWDYGKRTAIGVRRGRS